MDSDDDSCLYRAVEEWENQQLEGDVTDEQLCRALVDFETSAAAAVVEDEISDSALYQLAAYVEDTTAG